MALLLNNMQQPGGTQTTTPATNPNGYVSPGTPNQPVPALSAGIRTALGNIGQAILPSATYKPYQTPTQPITGLLSPSHPSVGSLPASSGIASHTVTTNPDNSVTSKVTYPQAPTGTDASATSSTSQTPAYNPSQPATTVYNNGIGTTNQGGTVVSGYTPTAGQNQSAQSTPAPTTFGGIVGGLANVAQGGSQNATAATNGLLQAPSQNAAIGQNAANIAAQYGANIARVGQLGSQFEGGQLTTGTSPVAEGNAAITAQTTAAQQQALAQGEQGALQGTAQELTAQNQGQSGLNAAGGIANTQQGNVQSGLQAAGSLAQPALGSIGQVPYSPLDLSQSAPLGTTQPGGVAAAGNLLGQFQGAQALGAAQGTGAAQGIQAQAAAPGQTQASNIQASGTAVTGANATGLAQSIQQETTLDTAASNATALANQVSTALTNSGLNLTNSTDANTAISNLQSRLGNSAYTQLNIAVNDARNAYGAILQATGATPTDAGNAANQNINANMSPKQILAAIDQLSQGVNARQQSQHAQTQQYQSQLSGSGTGGSTGNTAVNYNW